MMVAQLQGWYGLENYLNKMPRLSDEGQYERTMALRAFSKHFLSDKKLTEGLTPGSVAYGARREGIEKFVSYSRPDFRSLASIEAEIADYASKPRENARTRAKAEYYSLRTQYKNGTLPAGQEDLLRIIPAEEWNDTHPLYRPDVRPGLSVAEATIMAEQSDKVAYWRRAIEIGMENTPDPIAYLCRIGGSLYGNDFITRLIGFFVPETRKGLEGLKKKAEMTIFLLDVIFAGVYDSEGYLK